VLPAQPLPSDRVLDPTQSPFQTTNLKVPSVLRLHKLATIHSSSLVRHLGVVESAQQGIVASKLKTLLGL
jgi:mRNA-degrading endonuclease toxin of MazEF toxin-antitoxin module